MKNLISASGISWECQTKDKEEALGALREGADAVKDILDDIFEQRVEDTERRRDLLDTQIAETQRSLELEMDLMQEGYANNVDAKRKEVEELKKQRQQALIDEEEAIKKTKGVQYYPANDKPYYGFI